MASPRASASGATRSAGLSHIDAIRMFQDDPDTDGILMIGEIGGTDEEAAAAYIAGARHQARRGVHRGRTAPPGKRMGHAGAIISGGQDHKVEVAMSPAEMGTAMARALGL
jgi:succinyl-CoA synthetase alpha subunit